MQRATLITPAEYARSRGLAKSTISRQVRAGKIPVHSGKIDPHEADLARKTNLDNSRRPRPSSGVDSDLDLSGTIRGTPFEILTRARAIKELTIAKQHQLNLKKRQGELVEVSDIKRVWTNAVVAMEHRLFQMPDILAPRVAAMDDVLEIRTLIMAEVKAALVAIYSEEEQ